MMISAGKNISVLAAVAAYTRCGFGEKAAERLFLLSRFYSFESAARGSQPDEVRCSGEKKILIQRFKKKKGGGAGNLDHSATFLKSSGKRFCSSTLKRN